MKPRTGIRIAILATAALLLAAIIAVIACAPATPGTQDPTAQPTPAPTVDPNTKLSADLLADLNTHAARKQRFPEPSQIWKEWPFTITTADATEADAVAILLQNQLRDAVTVTAKLSEPEHAVEATMKADAFLQVRDALESRAGVLRIHGDRPIRVGDPAPTLAGTPPMIYLDNAWGTMVPHVLAPTATTGPPPIIEPNLQNHIKWYLEDKAKAEAEGYGPPRVKYWRIHVESNNMKVSDKALRRMLQVPEHQRSEVYKGTKSPGFSIGMTQEALISVIYDVAAIDGVRRISKNPPLEKSSLPLNSTGEQGNHGIANLSAWHEAGYTGKGIKVGVIDDEFDGFEETIRPTPTRSPDHNLLTPEPTIRPVFSYCWKDDSGPHRTIDYCYEQDQPKGHGTSVVEALLDIAPEAELYISSTAGEEERVDPAAKSLTGILQEVDVINMSLTTDWDGPGDGTSPFDDDGKRSVLNTVDDAITEGAIWVNSAGNSAAEVLFTRVISFDGNYLRINGQSTCNMIAMFTVDDVEAYRFRLRWSGPWQTSTDESEATDLALRIYTPDDPTTPQDESVMVEVPNEPQNGQADQNPYEAVDFRPTADGLHCIRIEKISGPDPRWVQFRSLDSEPFTTSNGAGSISNPGESANPGMMATGAKTNEPTPTLRSSSSQGPAPEPETPERIKPDIVADGTTDGDRAGATSIASPRIAGLAAVVMQAIGNHWAFDEPHEIAKYLKRHAGAQGNKPNNQWGYGDAALPDPEAVDLWVLPDNDRQTDIVLIMDPIQAAKDGSQRYSRNYRFEIENVAGVTTLGNRNGVTNIPDLAVADPIQGIKYQARAKMCEDVIGQICGDYTDWSDPFIIPIAVDTPRDFKAMPGHGIVTLTWRGERSNTGYEIEQKDPTDTTTITTRKTTVQISGLVNGTLYQFRVRTNGPGGPSAWTDWKFAVPNTPTLTPPNGLSASALSTRTVILRWFEQVNAVRYDVMQCQETAANCEGTDWRFLPDNLNGHRATISLGQAFVRSLHPGTTYSYRVRAVNGEERDIDRKNRVSGWSQVVTVTTQEDPDAGPAPTPATPTKKKADNLAAELVSQQVVLTWEAHTNPNYVKQQVWRRISSKGSEWTEFDVGLNDTTYTDITAVPGNSYIYRIRVEKANGGGGISNAAKVTIP